MALSPEDRHELETIITQAIENAFRDVGFDRGEVFELRRDLTFLREWRLTCELVRSRGIIAAVTLVMGALATVILLGFKGWIFQ